jgi:subtilisin family serine protease
VGHLARFSSTPSRARGLVLVAAASAACLVATLAPPTPGNVGPSVSGNAWTVAALDPGLPITGSVAQRVVVSGATGAIDAVRRAVEAVGGTLGQPLPIIDGVSATVPSDRLVELSRQPGVQAVTADREASLYGESFDEDVSASAYAWTSGATAAWEDGADGTGIGVAVLDTGVSAVNDLAGRVVHGPDLSGEYAEQQDSYGHGTVMAGVVAGSGVDAGESPRTGVAPGAHIVSVKVAGANGATDVSTVLAAMHWVASFRSTYNIRVMNLSWGVPSTQSPEVDPLSFGVQRLWGLGVTVVVAAGNSGPETGTITKPADDPLVVTVGAYDDRGDLNLDNDIVPKWSSQGPTAQGLAKPDLVAPGRTLIATRAPGSTVEAENPKALIEPSYIKGSGTSEAAAVVSGVAALMLSQRPELTPDQVKAALVSTASPIPATLPTAQGAGRVDAGRAVEADVSLVLPQLPIATGLGSLDASRGAMERVSVTCDGATKVLDDETSSWCAAWDPTNWTGGSWTEHAWTGGSWTGAIWDGGSWTGGSWTGDAWAGGSWTGASWTGGSWTGGSWTGGSWTGGSWTSIAFTGGSWTGGSWTSAEYDTEETFLNAFWGARPAWTQDLAGEQSEPAPLSAHGLTER